MKPPGQELLAKLIAAVNPETANLPQWLADELYRISQIEGVIWALRDQERQDREWFEKKQAERQQKRLATQRTCKHWVTTRRVREGSMETGPSACGVFCATCEAEIEEKR